MEIQTMSLSLRRLILPLILLLIPSISYAQSTLVTSTIKDPNGVAYAQGTFKISFSNPTNQQALYGGQPLTQVSFTGQLDASGNLSVTLPSNTSITPTGTQWSFVICANTAQIAGIYPPPTLPCATSLQTITGSTQPITFVMPTLPSSSGGGGITQVPVLPGTCTAASAPVQLTVSPYGIYTPFFSPAGVCSYVNSAQLGGAILPITYGLQMGWQVESTGANFTVTSGSATVTCTTCAFTSAVTGGEMFFTNWGGTDANYPTASAGPLTATTITFVNATTVTMSQNANLNAGTTNTNAGVLAWGPADDTTSGTSPWTKLENAIANGLNCQNAQISGITEWEKPHFLTASCRGITGGTTASKYPGITGFGVGAGATILLPPWFNATGCTGGTSGFACTGLGEWANINFNTLGQAGNITKNVNFYETFQDGTTRDMAFWGGWAAVGANALFVLNSGSHTITDLTVDGGPMPCLLGSNALVYWNEVFCGNGKGSFASLVIPSGTALTSYSMGFSIGPNGVGVDVTGYLQDYGSVLVNGAPAVSSACIKSESGGKIFSHGLECNNNGNAGSVAYWAIAGGYIYDDQAIFIGGGATNGAHLCPSGTCETGRGNLYTANGPGLVGCYVNSVSPAACGTVSTGAFVVPTTTTTYTVNTTTVTSNSQILITPRIYTGNLPGTPTCVVPTITAEPVVSAIVAGTSFTIALTSTTGQTCWNFKVQN